MRDPRDHTSEECGFCVTIVFDPHQTSDPVSGRPLITRGDPDVFFLGPTLDSILAAASSCPLAEWLVAEFRSRRGAVSWRAVCARSSTLKLCYAAHGGNGSGNFMLVGSLADEAGPQQDAICISDAGWPGSVCPFGLQGSPAAAFFKRRPMNRCPGSTQSFHLAREWLRVCQREHPGCVRAASERFMPKMVLEIRRKQPTGRDYHVSLCHPTSVSRLEPYTALSYCWGGQQPYQTTKARIDHGNWSLDWKRLPKTIQDAVRVTDELGFRFLWVDSLCIPQDDQEEKQEQIALMPQIYSYSTLTIVASRARRAEDGFLHDRDMASMPNLVVIAKMPFCSPPSFQAGEQNQDTVYLTCWGPDEEEEPLDSRGWALQERYLSSRILEFGTKQTSFYCSWLSSGPITWTDGWHVDESYQKSLPYTWNFQSLLIQEHNNTKPRPHLAHAAEDAFYEVVEAFTERDLSLRQDRILAISGIANHFRPLRRVGDEYLAGLWSHDLPWVLLWKLHAVQRPLPRPAPPIAPSWSWAAVEGQVELPVLSRGIVVAEALSRRPLAWRVELVNPSAHYGAASYGEIKGHGAMGQGLWFGHECPGESLSLCGLGQDDARLAMTADAVEEAFEQDAQVAALDARPGERFPEAYLPVALLHVGYVYGEPVGLVLRPCDGGDVMRERPRCGHYSRLGVFRCAMSGAGTDGIWRVKQHIKSWMTQDFILV